MSKNLNRVVLYFPKDHPISQYPQNIRNKVAKNMVERGLLTLSGDDQDEDVLKKILDEVNIIKERLSNGVPEVLPVNNMGAGLTKADIDLIDQMLGRK